MDINKEIISFVRNAGFKIGELTTQIYALSGDDDAERIELTNLRQHLILYSKILLPSEYDFHDDSINLLTWSSHDIIDEIHFLTAEARLSRVPYTNIDREIIELIVRTEKIPNGGLVDLGDLPVGTENDIWMFDNQGNIGLVNLNRYIGWFGEVPQQYFVEKKRIQTPTFLHAELVELNPLLRDGETVYIKEDENGRLVRKKVGPGFYNDIDFFEDDYFGEDLEVTNVLGDLPNNMKGLTVKEALTKIVAPDKDPVVTIAQNNALNGVFESEKLIEVGQSIAGPVLVNYLVSNNKNLAEEDPIVIFADGRFNNEGTFSATGQVSLSLGIPFIPTGLETLAIRVSSINSDGETIPGATTTIKSVARIISGFSTNPNLDASQFLSINGRTDTVTDNPEGEFSFIGVGYRLIAVPVMLIDSDGLIFNDVTYPGRVSPIQMEPGSVLTINNGVGTYDYQVYRSKYLLIGSSTIRVSRGSAAITSAWEIASRIVPKWADGTILDSSAIAGGVYVVKNKEERNLISPFQRVLTNRYSTLAYVANETTFYELINNPPTSVTQDNDWSPIVSNVDILQPLGTWDPTTNTPTLSDSIASEFEGNFYFVDNAGANFDFTDSSLFAGETTDLADGDWIISNGARWFRIKNRNVTWSNIFGIPSNVLLLAQGQVISHLHEISDINGLADALAGTLKIPDVASTTTDFALVPDSKIINLAFLKKYFYTKVEIQALLDTKLESITGILSTLNTVDKSNLVDAINEVLAISQSAGGGGGTPLGFYDFDASTGTLPTTGSGTDGVIRLGDRWLVVIDGTLDDTVNTPVQVRVGDVLIAKVNGATDLLDFVVTQSVGMPLGFYDLDASGGILPATGSGPLDAIRQGDRWLITVAGTLEDSVNTSVQVEVGDVLIAKANNPIDLNGFVVTQRNISLADEFTAIAGANNVLVMTPLRTRQQFLSLISNALLSILQGTEESFTTALLNKLNAIQAGATQNTTDAQLRDRSTHTGKQAISTVTGLESALANKLNKTISNPDQLLIQGEDFNITNELAPTVRVKVNLFTNFGFVFENDNGRTSQLGVQSSSIFISNRDSTSGAGIELRVDEQGRIYFNEWLADAPSPVAKMIYQAGVMIYQDLSANFNNAGAILPRSVIESISVLKSESENFTLAEKNKLAGIAVSEEKVLSGTSVNMTSEEGNILSRTVSGTENITITNPKPNGIFTILATGGTELTVNSQTPIGDAYDPSLTNIVDVRCVRTSPALYEIINNAV